jgi:hypothetical protein
MDKKKKGNQDSNERYTECEFFTRRLDSILALGWFSSPRLSVHLTRGTIIELPLQWNKDTVEEPLTVKKGSRVSRLQTGCHSPNSPWAGIIQL